MAGPTPDPPPPPNGPPSDRRGYDRITFRDTDGTVRNLKKAEFEELPLAERVRLLIGGKLQFFRDGQQVTAREALRGA